MKEAFNKIGFHLAEGGNPSGIGDWMKQLNDAGIPFFIKAADSMIGLFDAQEIVRKNRALGLEIPHTIVFRRSGDKLDVPLYELDPRQAAEKHWALHKAHFPTDLDRQISWVETINEVRKEVEWCDWLGKFATATGQMAIADGYRYAAFGFAAGTPDVKLGAWETDGMLQYLELCAQHPNQLGVALHEYSYTILDIWRLKGFLVGGFQWLFRTADKHGIPRPKTLITEWGWEYNRVPEPNVALPHIQEVAALYAQFPEILGAAIWYLGGGSAFGDIANQTQKLIVPLTQFSLTERYSIINEPAIVLLPGETIEQGTVPASSPPSDLVNPQKLLIRPMETPDLTWVKPFLISHWASERVVAHDTIYFPAELPGLVAMRGSTHVGHLAYQIAGTNCEIVSLATTQTEPGGIGTALVEMVKKIAQEAGCHKLWLVTTNDNMPALRFYQKRGFRLMQISHDAVTRARQIKPEIPLLGWQSIPLLDEIELEMKI